MIDFEALMNLVGESGFEGDAVYNVILWLALRDIPMTDAVINLGIAVDALQEGYANGWSKEVQL